MAFLHGINYEGDSKMFGERVRGLLTQYQLVRLFQDYQQNGTWHSYTVPNAKVIQRLSVGV
jgi:hypothetical protein